MTTTQLPPLDVRCARCGEWNNIPAEQWRAEADLAADGKKLLWYCPGCRPGIPR